jgi:hypothetical protein
LNACLNQRIQTQNEFNSKNSENPQVIEHNF